MCKWSISYIHVHVGIISIDMVLLRTSELRTPLLIRTLPCLLSQLHRGSVLNNLWNKDTSLIRTLYVVPKVSVIERFLCTNSLIPRPLPIFNVATLKNREWPGDKASALTQWACTGMWCVHVGMCTLMESLLLCSLSVCMSLLERPFTSIASSPRPSKSSSTCKWRKDHQLQIYLYTQGKLARLNKYMYMYIQLEYWQELNLVVGPKIATAAVLMDLNLAVQSVRDRHT